jgi:hypothetical protein
MATSTTAFPAAPGWRGLHLRPPAARAATPAPGFHTLTTPGELRPEAASAGWHFHLGADPAAPPPAQLITAGFHLGGPDAPDEAWAVVVPGGGLLGESRGRLQPALFAPDVQGEQDEDLTWVPDPAASACLVVRPLPEGRTRFALVTGEPSREPAEMRARLLVKSDPLARWAPEWALRQAAFEAVGRAATPSPAGAGDAIEQTAAAVQPPDRLADRRWLARLDDPRRIDVDATLAFVLAWRDIDRALARDVLASALDVAPRGRLVPGPYTGGPTGHRPPPGLALPRPGRARARRAGDRAAGTGGRAAAAPLLVGRTLDHGLDRGCRRCSGIRSGTPTPESGGAGRAAAGRGRRVAGLGGGRRTGAGG